MEVTQSPSSSLFSPTILDMFRSIFAAKTVQIAVSYNIPDLLQDGPKSVAELAKATGTHEDSLYRLLRMLSTIGFVERLEEKRFAETPLSHSLCSNESNPLRSFVLWLFDHCWSSVGALAHSVKTGQPSFEYVHGMDIWQWNATHPEDQALFNQAMASFSRFDEQIVLTHDFSSARVVADIGGGYGVFLRAILKAHPMLKGILYDISPVIDEAKEYFAGEQLEARCQLLAGDFLVAIPTGADIYILKHVLHNWNDQDCIRILSNCRAAGGVGSRIFIVEQVLSFEKPLEDVFVSDMVMLMVLKGARERSADEYKTLLEAAGFMLKQVVPFNEMYSLIEGIAI
ncbi:hypothetical protein EPA93_13165 [Ktedonosporobacter rubrisoli]|uniref:Uncharacterized protein n=1 Tax=Ktedonosporobacter rubrisoli TaxID=2509675 RepID=A0A4P6JP95_KTERU|nr:methyltransferase [Ktedonosporobacter rubrisoli]QBD76902.1 hypothetical protein EPA93_13165 [Ktedonosporobacter rubrisoli]